MPAHRRIPAHDILAQLQSTTDERIGSSIAAELGTNTRPFELDQHWLRGGYEASLFAADDAASFAWRTDFLRTGLPALPADRRGTPIDPGIFWGTLARLPGCPPTALMSRLQIGSKSIEECISMAHTAQLLRPLPAWPSPKSDGRPRLYLRDSGLVHRLLGIVSLEDLAKRQGPSWEGFAIESLIGAAPIGTPAWVYRDADTDEIDLVLRLSRRPKPWAIEIKSGPRARVTQGFRRGARAIDAEKRIAVYRGPDRRFISKDVEAMPLMDAMRDLQALR
jgi:hypothetical protein